MCLCGCICVRVRVSPLLTTTRMTRRRTSPPVSHVNSSCHVTYEYRVWTSHVTLKWVLLQRLCWLLEWQRDAGMYIYVGVWVVVGVGVGVCVPVCVCVSVVFVGYHKHDKGICMINVTYESGMSHVKNHVKYSWIVSHTWISHVTYEWVMSWMNTSCQICTRHFKYAWVTSHMHEPCHICMSHVTYACAMSHMNE